MRGLLILAAIMPAPSMAQTVSPLAPATAVDTQARTAAADAMIAAQSACQPMSATPPIEVPGGTSGSGTNCRLINSADNRISRTGVFTVGTSGNILCGGSTLCTWATPLPAGAASYPMFFTAIGAAAAPGVKCKVISSTNTGFSAACVQSAATISILGASVEVAAASGTQVYALALPSTQ